MERPSGAHRSAKPSGRDRILKRLLQLRHEDVRTDLYTRTGRDLFSRARLAPSGTLRAQLYRLRDLHDEFRRQWGYAFDLKQWRGRRTRVVL